MSSTGNTAWRNRIVGSDTVPAASLVPNPKNWRKHPEAQLKALAGALSEIGHIQDVIVNRTTGRIVDGHARVKLAAARGETIPVKYVELTEKEELLALATFDPLSAMAGIDQELLSGLCAELPPVDDAGLQALLEQLAGKPAAVEGEDDVPEVSAVVVSRPGDMWKLGPHRLLCGDATVATDVERLLAGAKPFLMVTDPPYGVEYDPEWRDEAAKAGRIGWGAKRKKYMDADIEAAWDKAHALFPGNVAYIWHAYRKAIEVGNTIQQLGFEVRVQIIWAKPRPVISRGHYNGQHEACWYAVRTGKASNWHGDHSQSTLWHVSGVEGNETSTEHGCQKPVELMRRPILNHTVKGDSVYDPFLGSGTTLIAAELTGRVCYGLEIDPQYCDVIVRRWQKQTGKEATLDGIGCTFEHAREGRLLGEQDAIKEEALSGT